MTIQDSVLNSDDCFESHFFVNGLDCTEVKSMKEKKVGGKKKVWVKDSFEALSRVSAKVPEKKIEEDNEKVKTKCLSGPER